MTDTFQIIGYADRPDYRDLISPVSGEAWPEFMMHDPLANRHWDDLYERFPLYQFAMIDAATDTPVAIGNSVALAWQDDLAELPEEGWDWAITQSMADHAAGSAPTLQCALQISIRPAFQGLGLSQRMVRAMKAIGGLQGLAKLIAPVRPSLKSRYPLTPIDRYVEWKGEDGLPFDPWLRVHARAGARIVKVCHQAMRIPGSVAQWEEWAGMRFPESAAYVVPGALNPVLIDREADEGLYIEPNVWMVHDID